MKDEPVRLSGEAFWEDSLANCETEEDVDVLVYRFIEQCGRGLFGPWAQPVAQMLVKRYLELP